MSQKCETKFCRHVAATGYVLCVCCLHGECEVWRKPSAPSGSRLSQQAVHTRRRCAMRAIYACCDCCPGDCEPKGHQAPCQDCCPLGHCRGKNVLRWVPVAIEAGVSK